MIRMLRALGGGALLLLIVPAAALATEAELGEEKVTHAMFVLIIALIAILAIAVAFEQRKHH